MKKLLLCSLAVLALGAGCGAPTLDENDIETNAYKLRVPDSATVTAITGGYQIQNFIDEDNVPDDAYRILITTESSVDEFTETYADAEESALGINDGAVWMASGYNSGDNDWLEDAYFHPDSGTLIVEQYQSGEGIIFAELVVNAITWK